MTAKRERVEITNESAFDDWCESHGFIKSSADRTRAKAAIKIYSEGGEALDPDSPGEVVPGIRKVYPGKDEYTVKITVGEKMIEGEE